MRLWTVHPKYLDAAGLVALWREALLAKAVLSGRTVGYRHHPQLVRFRETPHPIGAINTYLRGVHAEAERRGYHFSVRKIAGPRSRAPIKATRGQLAFEWSHLLRKLRRRSPSRYRELRALLKPRAHPQFAVRAGPVSAWEKHGGATRRNGS